MKKFISEFKEFISKGNVIDMSVAVIIGGAFGKIVTSLVNDIIMPLIGWITGRVNISALKYVITPAEIAADGTVIKAEAAVAYGTFLQSTIDFLIISFCIFVMLKLLLGVKDKIHKKKVEEENVEEAASPVETTDDILKDIRSLLQNIDSQASTTEK